MDGAGGGQDDGNGGVILAWPQVTWFEGMAPRSVSHQPGQSVAYHPDRTIWSHSETAARQKLRESES
jgi:hypothetical protein